jgi:hypothetical protein
VHPATDPQIPLVTIPALSSLVSARRGSASFPIKGKMIIDTGSGVHIVGKSNIHPTSMSLVRGGLPMRLNTANGQVDTDRCVYVGSNRFPNSVRACVLDNSPNVLSVGKLCAEGWTFKWPGHSKCPYLTSPEGATFFLPVKNNVPYLDNRDQLSVCKPVPFGAETFCVWTTKDRRKKYTIRSFTNSRRSIWIS